MADWRYIVFVDPRGSNFFNILAVFGNKLQNNTTLSGGSRIFPTGVRQFPNWDNFGNFLPKTA